MTMIKRIVFVLIILIPLLSSAQGRRPNRKEYSKYPNSRQKKEEKIYRHNSLISWKQWYEDGKNKMRKQYKDTKRHGKWSEWYRNGNRKNLTTYSNDSIIGSTFEWYENGVVMFERIYKDNFLTHLKHYSYENFLVYEEFYLPEKTKRIEYKWYRNHQKKEEKILIDGHIQSRIVYYSNGNRKLEENYLYGKVTGKAKYWNESGILKMEKIYKNGIPIKVTNYDDEGKLEKVNILDKEKYKKLKK